MYDVLVKCVMQVTNFNNFYPNSQFFSNTRKKWKDVAGESSLNYSLLKQYKMLLTEIQIELNKILYFQ